MIKIVRLLSSSYASDLFGETSSKAYVMRNRYTGVDGWKSVSKNGSNETNFKNTFSFFDGLDRINVSSGKKSKMIQILKENGYTTWPDGRSFDEVIFAI